MVNVDEPLKHLLRATPPWEDLEYTQCGRDAANLATTTLDAMAAVIKRHGKQRAAYTHCMTCIETQQRYARWRYAYTNGHRTAQATPVTWENDPAGVISRWVERSASRDPAESDRMRRTLHAIGALVEAHQDEFAAMVAADGVTDLAAHRRGRSAGHAGTSP